MRSHALPSCVVLLLAVIEIATGNNVTAANISTKHNVKKVATRNKIYGGHELKPPPETLTVTHEVWFDLKISNFYSKGIHFRQRITAACFGLLAPETCKNFIELIKGYKKGELYMSYRSTKIKSIIRDYMIILGDIKSRFYDSSNVPRLTWPREENSISHNHAGWLGRADFGPNTTGSEFYIILRPARWLDGKHFIFGKVLSGMNGLQTVALEETGADNKPLRPVILENCGVIYIKNQYTLSAKQFNSDEDVVRVRKP
ncbi:unnamed protein product [Candidula unifasciata]|uniref:Peptidyl-prolyl cis-trans isomerase n=1 Tax=Candidula unifasciata TaxID=100452 RepID=A0A8S3ZDF7_9EUPU|nr:unnamed protein product [Candidula unifasciata]